MPICSNRDNRSYNRPIVDVHRHFVAAWHIDMEQTFCMGANMSLSKLITQGPNPDKGLQAIVLQNYQDILKARQLLWTWKDIARELDIAGQENALRRSFARVEAKITKGKLKPMKSPAQKHTATNNKEEPGQDSPVTKRPLPGQQIPVGDGEAMQDELAKKGVVFK